MSDLRAMVWLWPPVAGLFVVALAFWHVMRARRLRSVFVSYRRSDSGTETARVVAALGRHFRRRGVFHDVSSIPPGADFRRLIAKTLQSCDAVIVVIGSDWATCVDAAGRPRLQADEDIVRSEVAVALGSGVLVIPVLVGQAALPRDEQLPAELRPLLRLNALRFDPDNPATSQPLVAAIRAAPMRRTPDYLALCHLSVAVQLYVFFLAGGLLDSELTTALAIVLPSLAATVAVMIAQRAGSSYAPARMTRVAPAALLWPIVFVASSSALILGRSFNVIEFDDFRLALSAVAIGFAAYTGITLATNERTGAHHEDTLP